MRDDPDPATAPVAQHQFDDAFAAYRAKWALPALFEIRGQTLRFTEIERRIGPVSHKALTDALRLLERDGYIERASYATIPPRVEYAITRLGEAAATACEVFVRALAEQQPQVVMARRRFDARSGGNGRPDR